MHSSGRFILIAASTMLLLGSLFVRFWTATLKFSTDPTHQWVIRPSPGLSNHLQDASGPFIIWRTDENGMIGQGLYDLFVGGGWIFCALFCVAVIIMSGMGAGREPHCVA